LFFTHLALEKILKAHWVKDNVEDVPPKTHNLTYLLNKSTLDLEEEDSDFLQSLNIFQLEGRYPDYLAKMHHSVQKTECEKIIPQAQKLLKCLQEKLR
jgi:HEPN domain-containing protein